MGNVAWSRTYGDEEQQWGSCVKTLDDGYLILGSSEAPGTHQEDIILLRTDLDGNDVWRRIYGGEYIELGSELVVTEDNNYIIVGTTHTSNWQAHNLLLMKTDSAGNVCWRRTYFENTHSQGHSIVCTGDGGFAIAGEVGRSNPSNIELLVMKTDAGGNLGWHSIMGNVYTDIGYSIAVTDDHGFIVAGMFVEPGYPTLPEAFITRLSSDPLLPVTISLSPHGLPMQIPAAGGSFQFDALLMNTLDAPTSGTIWSVVQLPNGQYYSGPELIRTNYTFEPGVAHSITNVEQSVPSFAPVGTYIYTARIGFYPNDIFAQDSFEFEKLEE